MSALFMTTGDFSMRFVFHQIFVEMTDKQYYVYIITNKYNTTLYIGVTNNLLRRIHEHKNKLVDGFSEKYNLTKLVYYEGGSDINTLLNREKQLKKWRREKKIQLIEKLNASWDDLFYELIG